MTQIKAFIFRNNDSDENLTVVLQDGGVASSYYIGDYVKTDYYQSRLNSESSFDTMWDELAEGKMYVKDWDGIRNPIKKDFDNEIIDDMINWLFISTESCNFIKKVEMGELTEETFEQVKQQLIFNEE